MTASERRGNERRKAKGYKRPFSGVRFTVFKPVSPCGVKLIHARYGPIGLVELNDGQFMVVRNPEIGRSYHGAGYNKFGAERAFNEEISGYDKFERRTR